MYTVDGHDTVHELRDVPRSSPGAPCPALVGDEHRLFLVYLVHQVDPGWDGTSIRIVGPTTEGEGVAVIEFKNPYAQMFGPPNDEAFEGHPLAERGLLPYRAFTVESSSWVRRLERMNAVHPQHRRETFDALVHYVFAFHDSTFECVAESYRATVRVGSVRDVVASLEASLS
jgi:hypothetical protein